MADRRRPGTESDLAVQPFPMPMPPAPRHGGRGAHRVGRVPLLDFAKVRDALGAAVVVDARNLLDPAQLRRIGFEYTGIGRR